MKGLIRLIEQMPAPMRGELKYRLEKDPGNLLVSHLDARPVALGVHSGRRGQTRAPFFVFVAEGYRRRGLGRQVTKRLRADARRKGSGFLSACVDPDEGVESFLTACGLIPWFDVEQMRYAGGPMPEPEIAFVPYQDAYYDAYYELQADAFYELRRQNDIQPYRTDPSGEQRRWCLDNASRLFLRFEESGLAAAGYAAQDGEIDHIAVRPDLRGRGLGAALVRHAVHLLQAEGTEDIRLHALTWNRAALRLYGGLGFVSEKRERMYRDRPEEP